MLIVVYADISRLDLEGEYELSGYRRERLSRTRPEEKRRQSIGAELLLNHAARMYVPDVALPLDIVCGRDGKPRLADRRFFFSLSHSGEYAAAAVADTEVGLDIQMLSHGDKRLIKRFFAPDEQEHILRSGSPDAAFTELWCKKESYVKALGMGLGIGLASFSVMNMPSIWHTMIGGLHLAVYMPDSATAKPDVFEIIF